MILREIRLDFDYQQNDDYIEYLQQTENLDYETAKSKDYEVNCRLQRREFRFLTRCMTSMIERLMGKIYTDNCKKIDFICTPNQNIDTKLYTALGFCHRQVNFDMNQFLLASDIDKKKIVVETFENGIRELSKDVAYDLSNVLSACEAVKNLNYVNEWFLKKKLKQGNVVVQIKIQHEVQDTKISMVFSDKKGTLIKEVLLIATKPDEWEFNQYLGKLKWIDENRAALVADNGDELVGSIL